MGGFRDLLQLLLGWWSRSEVEPLTGFLCDLSLVNNDLQLSNATPIFDLWMEANSLVNLQITDC